MSSAKEITTFIEFDPSGVERLSARTRPRQRIELVESDPTWPASFEAIASRIRGALGERALAVEHIGSTSVEGLAAKPVIDVDLVVADPVDEDAYAPDLRAAGFDFLFRERAWYEHRFFGLDEEGGLSTNVHVFGPGAPEPARHALFKDWLREHKDDRELYARAKREAAEASVREGESVQGYNARKQWVIREILGRVFEATGLRAAAEEEEEAQVGL